MKRPFELVAEIQEKDAEIERLRAQVKELSDAYQKAIGPIRPAEKDAEIERLKAENDSLIEQFKAIRETCYEKDKLITELADALEEGDGDGFFITENIELIQRAREATK